MGLTIGVLGPLAVTRDGAQRQLPRSRKTRALLAYLALTGHVYRREDLCSLLWEGTADPRSELRWSLAKIRAAIGPWLEVSSEDVGLASDGVSIDAVGFRALAREASSERDIADALAMWRGTPLADVEVRGQQGFQAWLAAERDALAALRAGLLKAAVDRAWARPNDALAAARRLVALEPWNEWGHARVAQLLERCGRTAEAAAYQVATRQTLSRELGVPPAQLLRAPPPPTQVVTSVLPPPRRGSRHTVRLEPLTIVPAGEDFIKLGAQITTSLAVGLWRSHSCDVLDATLVPRYHSPEVGDADFCVRGALVQWGNVNQVLLTCVNLHLGTIVWSGQVELGSPLTRGLAQWIREAVDAIYVVILDEIPDTNAAGNLRRRLIRARSLTRAVLPAANREALEILSAILAEDGDEPDALALAGWCYAQRSAYHWSTAPDRDRTEAKYCAAAATRLGIDEPECLTPIAAALTLVGDRNGAEAILDRALRLDAEEPVTHLRSGWLANYVGEPVRSARHFRMAMRLGRLTPGYFSALTGLGVAHFIRGDYAQAIRRMEQALALSPKATWVYTPLIPAYVAAGHHQKAEESLCTLVGEYPRLTVASVCDAMIYSPTLMTKISKGLLGAGMARV